MIRIFSEALNQILTEPRAKATARELADEAGISRDMIYKVKNDKANLSHTRARTLSRYMLRQYDDARLAHCFLTAEYEIHPRGAARSNGCIEDEITDMTVTEGSVVEAYRSGDRDRLSEKIGELEQIVERLKAERDRL